MRPSHLPTTEVVSAWPTFTAAEPLRILVSGCLTGLPVGVDGGSYGAPYDHLNRLLDLPNVVGVPFCPEDWAVGTPRETPDIHGGNGFDVLDGRARILSESGQDWTDVMVGAAHKMLDIARREEVRLALLMDISAACGTQVIYLGRRAEGRHQRGPGAAAALLIRHGIPVLSQRDFRSLSRVVQHLDPTVPFDEDANDHHESDWYMRNLDRPDE